MGLRLSLGPPQGLDPGDLVLTLLSAVGFSSYEEAFPGMVLSGWDGLYDGKGMAALIWLLAFFLALPCLIVVALATAVHRFWHRKEKPAPQGMTRRTFVKDGSLIPAAAFATSGAGNVLGESDLDTTHHVLTYKNLPDYLDGYKIGQLSDLHMGLFFSPNAFRNRSTPLPKRASTGWKSRAISSMRSSFCPGQRYPQANAHRFPDGIDFATAITNITAIFRPLRPCSKIRRSASCATRPLKPVPVTAGA